MKRIRGLAVAGAVLILLAGCGSVRPSKFYTLELPSMGPGGGPPVAVDLLVGRVSAPQVLRDDRILYRAASSEIGGYEYHRWVDPPALMLEELVLRALRDSGRFRSVQSQKSNTRGDYLVRGRLYEFGEISAPVLGARVRVEFEVQNRKTGEIVYTRMFSHDEPAAGKDVAAVVGAIDRSVQRALREFVEGLAAHFAQHPPQ